MVPLEDKEEIMFIGSPHFDSLGDLISSTTYLTNIPQDNMTMEIMFMNEQRRADVEMRQDSLYLSLSTYIAMQNVTDFFLFIEIKLIKLNIVKSYPFVF